MNAPRRHSRRRGPSLLQIWVGSLLIAIAVAVGGKLFEQWSTCSYHPGGSNCLTRLLTTKLYCYAAGLVIFLGTTVYVLIAAARRRRSERE